MEIRQVEAKHFKKGSYIMMDNVPCVVTGIQISRPGKHGHAKCRIEAVGLSDEKKRVGLYPGDTKIDSPVVDKRTGQIIAVQGERVQIMDVETYETFELKIPEKLKSKVIEGAEASYWVAAGQKILMDVKSA